MAGFLLWTPAPTLWSPAPDWPPEQARSEPAPPALYPCPCWGRTSAEQPVPEPWSSPACGRSPAWTPRAAGPCSGQVHLGTWSHRKDGKSREVGAVKERPMQMCGSVCGGVALKWGFYSTSAQLGRVKHQYSSLLSGWSPLMSHLFGKQISQLIDQQKPEPCKYTQSAKCVNQLNISIIIIWVSVINSVQYQCHNWVSMKAELRSCCKKVQYS